MADNWTDRLSEYLDGELDQSTSVDLEAHLANCAECSATLEQLRAVAKRAAALEDRLPQSDLWSGISSRIKQADQGREQVVDIGKKAGPGRRISFTVPQLLAAAIALMAVSTVSVWLVVSSDRDGSSNAIAESTLENQSAVQLAAFDDPDYDAAVAALILALEAGRDRLDEETIAVLERSLETIDQAIEEARSALLADPSNPYLNRHLSATMHKKVRLLRQVVQLAFSES